MCRACSTEKEVRIGRDMSLGQTTLLMPINLSKEMTGTGRQIQVTRIDIQISDMPQRTVGII